MQLYLARHGVTALNETRVYQGWTNISLSETGKRQCEILKQKLTRVDFDVVISSPLERAVTSAQIILGRNREQIVTEEGFKEFNFGLWEGLSFTEAAVQYPQEWEAWCADWQNAQPPQGENFLSFYRRVTAALTKLLKAWPGKTLLIVGHEGTLRCIVCKLLDLPPEAFWRFTFDPGCYSLVELSQATAVVKKINF